MQFYVDQVTNIVYLCDESGAECDDVWYATVSRQDVLDDRDNHPRGWLVAKDTVACPACNQLFDEDEYESTFEEQYENNQFAHDDDPADAFIGWGDD